MVGKRINSVDMAKGIALLFVIFGHTLRPSMCADYLWCENAYSFVYSFHVSLLFMLSGFGYAFTREKNKKSSVGKYVGKKAKNLLLPWFTYSVLIYLVFVVANYISPLKSILSGSSYSLISPVDFILAMLTNNNPYCFHVWYLQTLLLFVICTFLIDKFVSKSDIIFKILVVLLPAFYLLFCEQWVWIFKAFFQKYMLFLVGTMIPIGMVEKNKKKLSVLGLFCGGGLCLFLLKQVQELYQNAVTGMISFYVYNIVIVGFCIGILSVCCILENKLTILAKFGRNSMVYYMYHQPFCCAFLGIIIYEKMRLPAILTVVICMIVSIVVPFVITTVIKKFKIRKLFGIVGLPL